jgi:ABC-type sugar transport system substrate-binding protein
MKTLKIGAAVLTIAVALLLLNQTLHPKPLDEQVMPQTGVGQVLAEQAAKAMNDKGRVAVVCMPTGSVESQAQLQGFQRTLGKHKNITIAATTTFKPTEAASGKLNFQQFAQVINEHPNADVIVSFLGVTSFTDAQIASLPQPSPKLVVMDWDAGDIQRGMRAGLVKAAVTSRRLTALPTDDPKTPLQWFGRYYDLVTPQRN